MSHASVKMSNINNKYDRVVILVDMDCFYCQVEEKLSPHLKGKPIAVVQYNAWKGGGIIAVNYPARDQGVTRHMRGDEAKQTCPSIELVSVPNVREKADLSKYRNAGKEVAAVLQTFTPLLERASVDEAYLDITGNVLTRLKEMNKGDFVLRPDKLHSTYAVGYDNINEFVLNISDGMKSDVVAPQPGDRPTVVDTAYAEEQLNRRNEMNLLIGAVICNEIRTAVKEQTGYDCSAGIAHNKILSKLVCGINKPNKQTLLPLRHVNQLYKTLPVKKIKGLGGKFGDDVCETLKIKMMEELASFAQEELQRKFDEKNGLWLYLIGQGIDVESVTPRFASKSIGCCKNFPGRNAIRGLATLEHWFKELATEICDRIEKDEYENSRRPRQMVVSYTLELNNEDVASTRSVALPSALQSIEKLAVDALGVVKKNVPDLCDPEKASALQHPIKFLGISVGKFEDLDQRQGNTIESMFSNQAKAKAERAEQESRDNQSPVKRTAEDASSNVIDVAVPSPMKPSFFGNRKPATVQSAASSTVDVVHIAGPSSVCADEDSIDIFAVTESNDPDRYDDRPMPSAQLQPSDYKMTYAEFQCPASPVAVPSLAMEKCTQCNKKVLLTEMQSHCDAHFAFQLSQEQRAEFRSQIKAAPAAAKKLKMERNTSSGKSAASSNLLKKFLVNTSISNEQCSKCIECGSMIEIERALEHADYHAAKRLQLELNRKSPNSFAAKGTQKGSKNKKASTSSPVGGGRGIASVASFFKQAN